MACASCHDPKHDWGPPNARAVQLGGPDGTSPGVRAVPSLMYAQDTPFFTEHYREDDGNDADDQGPAGGRMWDGRVSSAREQAELPLLSPFEMANGTRASVVARLRQSPSASGFRAAFGDDASVAVRPVQCLSVCKRPSTVAVSGANGYTFLFGDLVTTDAAALTAFATSYRAAPFGLVPWRERAQVLRKGMIARVPPLAWSPRIRGMAGVVAPAHEDRVVATLSEGIGGPVGAHAGRHRWWTPVRVLLLLTAVVMALGMLQKSTCYSQTWENGNTRYTHMCYSDLPYLYTGRGLAERNWPYSDDADVRARYPEVMEYPVGISYWAWGTALVTQRLTGWPNLDARLRTSMRREIRDLHRGLGITILYVTHDQREAFEMSTQVVVLNEGRIEQQGTPEEVRARPQPGFVQEFLSE